MKHACRMLIGAAILCLFLRSCAPKGIPGGSLPPGTPSEWEVPSYTLPGDRRGKLVVAACGDALLTRAMSIRMKATGFKAPFVGVTEQIRSADIAFINLECPASFIGKPYPGKPENVTFRASPGALFALKWAGFDVVSLANNHTNDYGPESLSETLEYLDLLGLAHCGAGLNAKEAARPAIIKSNGLTVAFLAYAEPVWSVTQAGESSPGVAHAIIENLKRDVEATRKTHDPDHIFVSVHWGEEHQRFPNSFQKDFGHAAIDAGVSVVLGHHPHVLQGMERYGDGLIIYSLGNFVFDMTPEATYESAIFRIELARRRISSLEIEPVKIKRSNNAPYPATESEAALILNGLNAWSKPFGFALTIEAGRGFYTF